MRFLCLLALALTCAACMAVPAPPIVAAPAPTPGATLAPTATTTSSIDLSPYRAAMMPEFAAEVDRFGNAPQYQIDLTVAPDLSSFSATQQVRYTNTETEPLKEIYFTLLANLPSYGGELKVQSVKLNGQTVTPQFEQNDVLLKIDLPAPLPP